MDILITQEAGVDDLWSERERSRVTRLCAVITGEPAVAEDLAQETLLEAWRIRHRLVDPSGRGPWVDAIARHVCSRWRVRRGRLAGHEVTSDRPADEAGAPYDGHDQLADVLERAELVELLERALALLPDGTREALVARYVDELGPAEIAARLALSPDAVSMRLTRGRARLRELLETELHDEPLARVWVERHGVAWRPTRLPCATCGQPATSMRRDPGAGVVELRCARCDPDVVQSAWRLDNPSWGSRLSEARRPSTVLNRMADWSHAWWPTAIEAGTTACTRCGGDVPVRAFERPGEPDARTGRGWQVTCSSCGEALSASLLGLVLAGPETRRLRALRPRAHAVPTRRVTRDGRDVLVVALRDDASGDAVEMLFDDATTRPLAVVAAR